MCANGNNFERCANDACIEGEEGDPKSDSKEAHLSGLRANADKEEGSKNTIF